MERRRAGWPPGGAAGDDGRGWSTPVPVAVSTASGRSVRAIGGKLRAMTEPVGRIAHEVERGAGAPRAAPCRDEPAHRLAVLLSAGLALISGTASAQAPEVDLEVLLARVGGRIERYFQRSQSIVSTETVSVLSFDRGMRLSGRPRRLVYERHVEWGAAGADGVPSVRIARALRSVNGRPPGPDDEDACLTPETEDDDPLALLLPARQVESDFRLDEVKTVDGRPVAKLSFTPIDVQPGEVERDGDCVHIELEGWYGGDAWVDMESGDVLRLDRRLTRRFEFREGTERSRAGGRWNRLERDDSSIRYERIAFEDPDETLMLPRSIEHNWSIEGGGFIPRYFRTHRFSDYRRFVTGGRLLPPGAR